MDEKVKNMSKVILSHCQMVKSDECPLLLGYKNPYTICLLYLVLNYKKLGKSGELQIVMRGKLLLTKKCPGNPAQNIRIIIDKLYSLNIMEHFRRTKEKAVPQTLPTTCFYSIVDRSDTHSIT